MSGLESPNSYPDATDDQTRAVLAAELDLEIGIRKRVAQTLEDRISWAQRLRSCLTAGRGFTQDSIQDIALDALADVEKPLNFLRAGPDPSTLLLPPPPVLSKQPTVPLRPPPPKPKVWGQAKKAGRFLYCRSGDDLFILACPTCQKTQFLSLQGLYNHGRLSHQLEWGTHEDCVRACSQRKDDMVLENGTEVVISLRGVRGLFQQAVNDPDPAADDHLNATLGLHAETPALAAVLGKTVKRREIAVHDADALVDIDAVDDGPPPLRVPALARNTATVDLTPPEETEAQALAAAENTEPAIPTVSATGSRFYFTTRVIVTDRSMFIPPEQQLKDNMPTHKWMVSVEAPSYSLDITTVLKSVTATSLSDYIRFEPITCDHAPYILMGVASKPFLCQLELLFNPTQTSADPGQRVILEHWVDLDTSKQKYACKGDEQIVDVELHKDTIILPATTQYTPIDSRVHWRMDTTFDRSEEDLAQASHLIVDVPRLLKEARAEYPLTAQESKRRFPYYLAASQDHFDDLVLGRQKAIEWVRARAIRDRYRSLVREQPNARSYPVLSTADLVRWLKLNIDNHSPHINGKDEDTEERFCLVCGLPVAQHDASDLEDGCTVYPERWRLTTLPMVDIDTPLPAALPSHQPIRDLDPRVWTNRLIVKRTQPQLLLAVRDIVARQKLSHVPSPALSTGFPLDAIGEDVYATLAPYGVLALATQQFIKRLVEGGIKRVARRRIPDFVGRGMEVDQEEHAARESSEPDEEASERSKKTRAVLTPSHILQGLVGGQWEDRLGQVMFYSLAKPGRRLDGDEMDIV
ncbi:hypothetical protein CYLTODRAFT_75625 [Cylindrobasidium torrendii FP15055 ss-10]|uniref:YEATS domain-containing protein n=1 Tax=Cylindrobasidium torrendii FP15055 ss-10 TaxID=1314674 RepID=A0A0D7B4E1_9AGAR|nr:hypothetical protein CYLTODRAFT_75625 [Cylindrobasidium torrendii FP15055 ss-10]